MWLRVISRDGELQFQRAQGCPFSPGIYWMILEDNAVSVPLSRKVLGNDGRPWRPAEVLDPLGLAPRIAALGGPAWYDQQFSVGYIYVMLMAVISGGSCAFGLLAREGRKRSDSEKGKRTNGRPE